ncbi:hypothetical protein AZE42_11674, partial [Rhizopogon vesiculosus]
MRKRPTSLLIMVIPWWELWAGSFLMKHRLLPWAFLRI